MNNVQLFGRFVREPEKKNGATRFTLAVDKGLSKEKLEEAKSNNKPTADFINCVAFGKQADFVMNYLAKGCRAIVTGRINTGSYKKQDGSTVYTTDIICFNVTPIDWKESNTQADKNDDFEFDFDDSNDEGKLPF